MGGWIRGSLLLLAFYALGMLLQKGLSLPLPGNLLGMLLLATGLLFGWIKLEWVEQASSFFLKHMLLFFVPIIVGAARYADVFAAHPIVLLSAMLMGPPLVMWASGAIMQKYAQKIRRDQQRGEQERGALHA
ncbi:CidA/LrgA family protein [Brevibacillus fulvus]|nr:CidA/LrgA family protein [Brevibacillus fulvus]